MRKLIMGAVLSLFASTSFAQAVITFDVDFNRVLVGAGSFVPVLYDITNDPGGFGATGPAPNLTGTVTLTALPTSTLLDPSGVSSIELNGTWKSDWPGASPSATNQTFTYTNAVFDLYQTGGKFANDFTNVDGPSPQGLFIGTAIDGILSDHGASTSPCPWATAFFGGGANCESANPALLWTDGTATWAGGPAGSSVYGGTALADGGNHPLISGTHTFTDIGSPDLGHDNGLDGFQFVGGLCTGDLTPCGGQNVPDGGVVQIWLVSGSGDTVLVVEGVSSSAAAVPVPAAVWLFGSALGLLGWMRRRVAA